MKRWYLFAQKACLITACAVLLPDMYESARQSILGWPRQAAREGLISDTLIIKKQGLETAMVADFSGSTWNSTPTEQTTNPTQTSQTANPAQTSQTANPAQTNQTQTTPRVIRTDTRSSFSEGPGKEYAPVMSMTQPIVGYLGGSKLHFLSNQTNSQMLSAIVETNQGKLIVIDGGTADDGPHLAQALAAKGGHVDAWLITHPHSDHVGALYHIIQHPEYGITTDNVYYSFPDLSWYREYESGRADMVEATLNAFAALPPGTLHGDIDKGQEIVVDNVKITVMNRPYLFAKNSINNSSVAYMLDINGRKALFLGDMGEEAGKQLIADYPPEQLKCDIVQMAHHGQQGVGFEVYRILQPEICLWGAPEWLWNNDSGSGMDSANFKTIETRKWMAQLGVPFHLCIKDGDQVIQ